MENLLWNLILENLHKHFILQSRNYVPTMFHSTVGFHSFIWVNVIELTDSLLWSEAFICYAYFTTFWTFFSFYCPGKLPPFTFFSYSALHHLCLFITFSIYLTRLWFYFITLASFLYSLSLVIVLCTIHVYFITVYNEITTV